MKRTSLFSLILLACTSWTFAMDSCCDALSDDLTFLKEKTCDIRAKTSVIQAKTCTLLCTATEIKEKVCQLLADSSCDYVITQKDIMDGDAYVISEPGTYCLGESVEFSTGTGIRIENTNCVVLDLNGHTMNGLNSARDGILAIDSQIIIIKDGIIKDMGDGNDPLTTLSDGICVNNCQNVMISDIKVHSVEEGFTAGIDILNGSSDVLVERCSVTVSSSGFRVSYPFFVENVRRVILKDCVASSCLLSGFYLASQADHCCILNCKSMNNGANGFLITGDRNVLIGCQAFDNNEGDAPIQDGGFAITGDRNVIRDCDSIDNDREGFCVSGNNCTLKNCTATDNGNDGFDISGSNTKVLSSCALDNEYEGFDNNGGSSNFFANNVSMNNGGSGNYDGISQPIVSSISVTDTIGFWANISGS